MIRKALEKLNEQQLKYMKTMSTLIACAKNNGAQLEFEKKTGKLRGYLECLEDMGIISQAELRSLYLWFVLEDRSNAC